MRVSLCLAILALAGCAAPLPIEDPADPVQPPAIPLTFAAPVEITTNGYGYEPSIDVAADGTLYATAARNQDAQSDAAGLASWVWFSKDNGTTWTEAPSPAGAQSRAFAFEGDTSVDAVGNLYFVDTTVADVLFHRWKPSTHGPTWESARPLATSGADDRPWLVASGDGVLYYWGNAVASTPDPLDGMKSSSMHIHVSTDAGATWTAGSGLQGAGWCGLAANPATPNHALAGCYGESMWAFETQDTGATWERVEAAARPAAYGMNFPAAALDAAGNAYITWIDGRPATNDENRLQLALRQNGSAWRDIDVTPFIGTFAEVWVAAGSPGVVALTFYGSHDTTTGPGSDWFAYAMITHDAFAESPTWQVATLDPTKVKTAALPPGDFFQSTFGPDDRLHAAFARYVGENPDTDRLMHEILYARQATGANLVALASSATG